MAVIVRVAAIIEALVLLAAFLAEHAGETGLGNLLGMTLVRNLAVPVVLLILYGAPLLLLFSFARVVANKSAFATEWAWLAALAIGTVTIWLDPTGAVVAFVD